MKFQIGFVVLFACVVFAVAEDTPAASTEKVCEPGKEFKKDCNVCRCNVEGSQFTCETKDCSQTVTQAPSVSAEEKCTPGELYKNKCNECRCPESGLKAQAACTVIGCPDE